VYSTVAYSNWNDSICQSANFLICDLHYLSVCLSVFVFFVLLAMLLDLNKYICCRTDVLAKGEFN